MATPEREVVDVAVSVADPSATGLQEMVDRLRQAGLEVRDVMEGIGTVTGSIERSRIPELSMIEGVTGVEQSRDYGLPPPEADIQ